MNHLIRTGLAVLTLFAGTASMAQEEEKVQKITFLEDDAQKVMTSKIYKLKYMKAADLAPFVRDAVLRYTEDSKVAPLVDTNANCQMLVVSSGEDMLPYVDEIVKVLDRPSKLNQYGSGISGTGIYYGFYKPQYRSTESMLNIVINSQLASPTEDGMVKLDPQTGMFYFKDTPSISAVIKDRLTWLDKPEPQARIELKVYEIRDSDLRDIGIDYLAWKNGPGMNLFSAGYDALSMKVSEKIIEQIAAAGIDLAGSFNYGFGGMYTAPAFDMSFIRILQQNGKATISSTASLAVANRPEKTFSATFAPQYQNITKDGDHRSNVETGADASLNVEFSDTVITGGNQVNFTYTLTGSNVVERNNMGAELTEQTSATASVTMPLRGEEVVLTSWNRTAKVEQTIGVPVLCEIPVLKYLFGTTTENMETISYVVTAQAVPLNISENMEPGIVAEFDDICRK